MPFIKRLAVWFLERVCELLLLSMLLTAIGGSLPRGPLLTLVFWILAGGIFFVWGTGYLFTTAIFGVVWRSPRWWLYPTIAVVVAMVHRQVFLAASLWNTISDWRFILPCLVAVFVSTSAGNVLLRRWGRAGSKPPFYPFTAERPLIPRTITIWFLELTCVAVLLSMLLAALSWRPPEIDSTVDSRETLLAVLRFMLGYGFPLTTAIFATTCRNRELWLYPAISAALFLAHLEFARLVSSSFIEFAPPLAAVPFIEFRVGGAAIVLVCTFAGTAYYKWAETAASKSDLSSETGRSGKRPEQ